MFSIHKNNFKRDEVNPTEWTNVVDMWMVSDEKEEKFYSWIKENGEIIKQPKWDRLYQTAKVEISCDVDNEVPKQELVDKLVVLFKEYHLDLSGTSIDKGKDILHLNFAGECKIKQGV